VELKRRAEKESVLVPVEEVIERVKAEIEAMTQAIMAKVKPALPD
jgi:hypothetical protein